MLLSRRDIRELVDLVATTDPGLSQQPPGQIWLGSVRKVIILLREVGVT